MKPGMQGGQAVAVKFTLPVTFMLEGSKHKPQAGDNDVVVVGYGVTPDPQKAKFRQQSSKCFRTARTVWEKRKHCRWC